MEFDFAEHFKTLKDSILSLFKAKGLTMENDEDEGDRIEIEDTTENAQLQDVKRNETQKQLDEMWAKKHQDIVNKITKPMGIELSDML